MTPYEIPAGVVECQKCFEEGRCPPGTKREQTTIDNATITVLCRDCLENGMVPVPMIEEGGVDNG